MNKSVSKSTESSDKGLRIAIRVTFIVSIVLLLLACLFAMLNVISSILSIQYPVWLLNCWFLADFLMLLVITFHGCIYTLLLAQMSGEVAGSLFIGTGIIIVPSMLGLFSMTSYYLPVVSILSLVVLSLITIANLTLIRGGICSILSSRAKV